MEVLVTGASGFVGRPLCAALSASGERVRACVRKADDKIAACEVFVLGEIGPDTDWDRALGGIQCVVHLAARAHMMDERAADPLAECRRVNVEGTRALARAAVRAGVRRLVYVSSIKVNGESTTEHAFRESDEPRPQDAYGVSKWEAELALAEIAAGTSLETVVLRPPLVYGPHVKGNFLALLGAVHRGLPLPLDCVRNVRSLLYVGNLVSAIAAALTHPAAANRTFLVSDGEDVSSPQLVRQLAAAFGRPARLLPLPVPALRTLGVITGKAAAVARLTGSLQVDAGLLGRTLDWTPPFTLEAGLRATANWYAARTDH
jgi:nucleoside-diphosphate-sugar epimerase